MGDACHEAGFPTVRSWRRRHPLTSDQNTEAWTADMLLVLVAVCPTCNARDLLFVCSGSHCMILVEIPSDQGGAPNTKKGPKRSLLLGFRRKCLGRQLVFFWQSTNIFELP